MDPLNFINGFQSTVLKNRLHSIEMFLKRLKQKPLLNDIAQSDLKLKVMSYCIFLMRDSNSKIVNIAFECLKLLIEYNGHAFQPLNNIAFDLLLVKFGDHKLSVRQKATEIMPSLISSMTLQVGFDRLMAQWENKNFRVKEHILYTIIKLQEKYGDELKILSNLVPTLSCFLDDQNISVKTLAIDTLLKLSSIFGEEILKILSSSNTRKDQSEANTQIKTNVTTNLFKNNNNNFSFQSPTNRSFPLTKDSPKSKVATNNAKVDNIANSSPKWRSPMSPTTVSPTRQSTFHSSVSPSFGPQKTPKSPYLKAPNSAYLKSHSHINNTTSTISKISLTKDNYNKSSQIVRKSAQELLKTADRINNCNYHDPNVQKENVFIKIDQLVLFFDCDHAIPVCPSLQLTIGDSIFKTHRHLYLKAETTFSDLFVLPIKMRNIKSGGVNITAEVLVDGLDKNHNISIGKGELKILNSGSLEKDKYFDYEMSIRDNGIAKGGKLVFRALLFDQVKHTPSCQHENKAIDDVSLVELVSVTLHVEESEHAKPLECNTTTKLVQDVSFDEKNTPSIKSSHVDCQAIILQSPKRFISPKIINLSSRASESEIVKNYLSESDNDTCISDSKRNVESDDDVSVQISGLSVSSPVTMNNSYIKVFVRIAPMANKANIGCEICNKLSSEGCLMVLGKKQIRLSSSINNICNNCSNKMVIKSSSPSLPKSYKVFNFDEVFPDNSTQDDVFNSIKNSIASSFDGFNSTIFTYGSSNTGKTYTMYGDNTNPGLIPRTIKNIFQLKNKSKVSDPDIKNLLRSRPAAESSKSMSSSLSEDEVTSELSIISNSMKFTHQSNKIDLHEDKHGQQYFSGPMGKIDIKLVVHSEDDALRYLSEGVSFKKMSRKKGEEEDTKSHTILTFYVTKKTSSQVNIFNTKTVTGKVHLIDLASSDKISTSTNRTPESNEGSKISVNLSILALGEVLNRLSINSSIESKKKGSTSNFINQSPNHKLMHIPYLNSKLTFFLKDSLGGNTKTTMITTILPDREFYTQTLNSLTFASKATAVLNHAKPNRSKIVKSSSPTKLFRPKSELRNSKEIEPLNSTDFQYVESLSSSKEITLAKTTKEASTSPFDEFVTGLDSVIDRYDLVSCTSSVTFDYDLHELVSIHADSDLEYAKLYENNNQDTEGESSDPTNGIALADNPLMKNRLSPTRIPSSLNTKSTLLRNKSPIIKAAISPTRQHEQSISVIHMNETFHPDAYSNIDKSCENSPELYSKVIREKFVVISKDQEDESYSLDKLYIEKDEYFFSDAVSYMIEGIGMDESPTKCFQSTSAKLLSPSTIKEKPIETTSKSSNNNNNYSNTIIANGSRPFEAIDTDNKSPTKGFHLTSTKLIFPSTTNQRSIESTSKSNSNSSNINSTNKNCIIATGCRTTEVVGMNKSSTKVFNLRSVDYLSQSIIKERQIKSTSKNNSIVTTESQVLEKSEKNNSESFTNDKADLVSCSSSITFDYDLHELMSLNIDVEVDYNQVFEDKSDIVEGIVFSDRKNKLKVSFDSMDSKERPSEFIYNLSYSQSNDHNNHNDLMGIEIASNSSEMHFDEIYKDSDMEFLIPNEAKCKALDQREKNNSKSEHKNNVISIKNITTSSSNFRSEISLEEKTVSYDKVRLRSSDSANSIDDFSLENGMKFRSGISPSKDRLHGLSLNSYIKKNLSGSQDGTTVFSSPKKVLAIDNTNTNESNNNNAFDDLSSQDNTTVVDISSISLLQKESVSLFEVKQQIKYQKRSFETLKNNLRDELENLTLLRKEFSNIGYDESYKRDSFFTNGIESHLKSASIEEKYGAIDSDSDVEYDSQPIYERLSNDLDDSFDHSDNIGRAMKIAIKSGRKQEYKSHKLMELKISKEAEVLCSKELREIEELRIYKTEQMIVREEAKYQSLTRESDKITSLKLLNACSTKCTLSLATLINSIGEEIDLLKEVIQMSFKEFTARRKAKARAKAIKYALIDAKNEVSKSPLKSIYKQLLFENDDEENKVSPTKSVLKTSQLFNYIKANINSCSPEESRVNSSIDSYEKKSNSITVKKLNSPTLKKKQVNISEFFHVNQSQDDMQTSSDNRIDISSISQDCRNIEVLIQSSKQVLNELNKYLQQH